MALSIMQQTLKSVVKATGVTVHSGERAELVLRPAPVNTGIVFCVRQNDKVTDIPALSQYVGDTTLSTTLTKDGVKISTVEHLMSALAGLGVDNAYIDINASEIPIMDGSAGPFVFLIQSAGIEQQNALKRFIRIKKAVEVKDGDRVAKIEPYNGFRIDLEIAFKHKLIKKSAQKSTFDFSTSAFVREVSRARTFGFLADYERIRAMDLAKGASLDNAVVLDEYRVLNEDGLRFPDEFVKHKILDAVGDLYLMGGSILGAFSGYKSGHAMNDMLLKSVLADQAAWEYATFDGVEAAPQMFFQTTPVLATA